MNAELFNYHNGPDSQTTPQSQSYSANFRQFAGIWLALLLGASALAAAPTDNRGKRAINAMTVNLYVGGLPIAMQSSFALMNQPDNCGCYTRTTAISQPSCKSRALVSPCNVAGVRWI